MKRTIRALALLALISSVTEEAFTQWIQTAGPEGGHVTSLAAAGLNVVAGTWMGGIFRSTDGGSSWTEVGTGMPRKDISSMTSVTTNYFAGSPGGGFYHSSDEGASWIDRTFMMPFPNITMLAHFGTNIYAGCGNGKLFTTADFGNSWAEVDAGLPHAAILSFAVMDSTLYVGTSGSGVYASVDMGTNWHAMNEGMTYLYIHALVVSGGQLFVGSLGVYTSTNHGASWIEADSGLTNPSVFALASDGINLYAGTQGGGVFITTDNGAGWAQISSGMTRPMVNCIYANSGRLVAGTEGGGMFRSTDNGASWTEANSGFRAEWIRTLLLDGSDMLAGTDGGGIYRTTNDGASWFPVNNGMPDPNVWALVRNGADLFAGINAGNPVYRSTNDGASWSPASIGLASQYIQTMYVAGGRLFAGTNDAGIFRSTNNGASWQTVNNGLPDMNVTSLCAVGPNLFAGTRFSGVFISADYGNSWNGASSGLPGSWVNSLGAKGTKLFAGIQANGAYVSSDNGASWGPANSGMGSTSVYSFVVAGQNMFASANDGVYLSTHEGDFWRWIGTGLSVPIVNALALKGNHLFGGVFGNGVWTLDYSGLVADGSISGKFYNDQNGNGVRDDGEVPLSGWTVYLSGDTMLSKSTDSQGDYKFSGIPAGNYIVSEDLQDGWLETQPKTPPTYSFGLNGGDSLTGNDFGNVLGNQYIGSPGGNWSSGVNWSAGHVPETGGSVQIPTTVVVDALPNDSLNVLECTVGGSLVFNSGVGALKIGTLVRIDSGGVMTFPGTGTNTLICNGTWHNAGQFNAGNSTVTFMGGRQKNIRDWQGNAFHNLIIADDNTAGMGNVSVSNRLTLSGSFGQRNEDTVSITNNDTSAIESSGVILRGSLRRLIAPLSEGTYRFHSPGTFVKFHPGGPGPGTVAQQANPLSVTVTTTPDMMPYSDRYFKWEVVGGTVDSVNHWVRCDSVRHFTKWGIGVPGTGGTVLEMSGGKSVAGTSAVVGVPSVRRMYDITADGTGGFLATLQLSYLGSETTGPETGLTLMTGPVAAETVHAGWNMVSLPVRPANTQKGVLFPGASSLAFKYSGGYKVSDSLSSGVGYWIKYPGETLVAIEGGEIISDTIPLAERWNLIGVLSYPASPALAAFLPPGISPGVFFGYRDGYFIADSLMPTHAYWLKTFAPGWLILSGLGVPGNPKQFGRNPLHSMGVLELADGSGACQRLYFGQADGVSADLYAMPPAPPEGVFDARFSSGNAIAVPGTGHNSVTGIRISSALYPVTVAWERKDVSFRAWLLSDGRETELIGRGKMLLKTGETALSLKLSPPGAGEGRPREFALHQNYPNPFNPLTSLSYELPVSSRVTLKIYNLLGETVKLLIDGTESAGMKTVEWDAGSVATGVYFYRLEAAASDGSGRAFIQVKKMMVIR